MIRRFYLYNAFLSFALFGLSACSGNDDIDLPDKGEEQTWQAEVNATKEGGDVEETRAIFFGGNTGTRYFSLWDSGDNADVYYNGTKVGTFAPNSYGFSNSKLTGTLTGTYAVGNTLNMYIPKADLDFTGQKGTLGDMSGNHTFMEATAEVAEVNSLGQYVDMGSTTFRHRQFFFRFRFSDTDGFRLHVKKLTIHAAHGQLVKTKPLNGTATYGDIVVNTVKEQNAYPDELFVALWNDYRAGTDTYSFTVEADNGYIYESVDDATRMIRKDNAGAFTRVHRALPMKSAAVRVQPTTDVTPYGNGGYTEAAI